MKEVGLLKERLIPAKIYDKIPTSKINKDLKKYHQMSMDMGATNSAVISSNEIVIDERVRAKCIFPKCDHYGTNINCPPHAPDLDFVRKMISKYQKAILFSIKGETRDFIKTNVKKHIRNKVATRMLLNKICSKIESSAFYEGYYFALALGQGPCKPLWCPDKPCQALQVDKGCRFALKARSCMEAVGIDVFTMVAKKGWEIYPFGARVDLNKVPHALLVGLILIV
jgi:predicted metal-binding protein